MQPCCQVRSGDATTLVHKIDSYPSASKNARLRLSTAVGVLMSPFRLLLRSRKPSRLRLDTAGFAVGCHGAVVWSVAGRRPSPSKRVAVPLSASWACPGRPQWERRVGGRIRCAGWRRASCRLTLEFRGRSPALPWLNATPFEAASHGSQTGCTSQICSRRPPTPLCPFSHLPFPISPISHLISVNPPSLSPSLKHPTYS